MQRELGAVREPNGQKAWAKALRYSAVGIEFGLGAALGYLAGRWLDRRFGTEPVFTLVLLLLGIAAAFTSLFRIVRESQADQGEHGDEDERS